MAILYMAYRPEAQLKVLTVCPLRLPQSTYDFIDTVRLDYPWLTSRSSDQTRGR